MSATTIKKVNNFFHKFLTDNNVSDTIIQQFKTKEIQSKLRKALVEKDKNAPTKPKTAYFYFCEEIRPDVKEELSENGKSAPATEVVKEIAKRWRNNYTQNPKMTKIQNSEYKRYQELASEAKAKFQLDKKEYDEKKLLYSDKVETATKRKVGKKRPKNAYSFYQSHQYSIVKEKLTEELDKTPEFADITKVISSEWNKIKNTDAVEKYRDMAEVEKLKFLAAEEQLAETPQVVVEPKQPIVSEEEDVEEQPKVTRSTKQSSKKTTKKSKKEPEPVVEKEPEHVEPPQPKEESVKPTKNAAFYAFVHENKSEYKKNNPEAKALEINKAMRQMWRGLSDDEKDQYRVSVSVN